MPDVHSPHRRAGHGLALAALIGVAALALLASATETASAKKRSFPTTIAVDSSTHLGEARFLYGGRIGSPKRRCRFLRIAALIARFPSGRERAVDIDLTSFNGAWALTGNLAGATSARIVIPRERRGRRVVCKGARVGVPITPPPANGGA